MVANLLLPRPQCMLMIADTQLVTGFAIAISGYSSFSCGLSVYHWKMLVYLVWFSCVTHLAALTCLRTYLHVHWIARFFRLTFMALLMIFIIVGLVPTGHFNFSPPNP